MKITTIAAAMLCCLLAFAASASAECAWVLWYTFGETLNVARLTVRPVSAHATQQECHQEAKKAYPALVESYGTTYPNGAAYLTCLPDTVDPRGLKAK